MAYLTSNPPAMTGGQTIGGNGIWYYTSADVSTDVDASNYFTNGLQLGMKVGDTVHVIETDNAYAHTIHSVTEVSADGATVSAAT